MDESVVTQSPPLAPSGSAPGQGDGQSIGDVTSPQGQDNQANVQQMIPASDFQKFQSQADRRLAEMQRQLQQVQTQYQQTQSQSQLQQQFETRATQLFEAYRAQGMEPGQAEKWASYYAEQEVTRASELEALRQENQTYKQQQQQAQTVQSLEGFAQNVQKHYGITDEQLRQATSHLSYRTPDFQNEVHMSVQRFLAQAQQTQQQNVGLRNDLRFAQPGASAPVTNNYVRPPGVQIGSKDHLESIKQAREQARRNRS